MAQQRDGMEGMHGICTFAVLRRRRIFLRIPSGPGPSEHRRRKSQKDRKHLGRGRRGQAGQSARRHYNTSLHAAHALRRMKRRKYRFEVLACTRRRYYGDAVFVLARPACFSCDANRCPFFVISSRYIRSDTSSKLPHAYRYDREASTRISFPQGEQARVLQHPVLILLKCFSHRANASGFLLGCLATTISDPALPNFTAQSKH